VVMGWFVAGCCSCGVLGGCSVLGGTWVGLGGGWRFGGCVMGCVFCVWVYLWCLVGVVVFV